MTTISIPVNKFDDWGQVVGTKIVEMTQEQIADVVGHAAQLIAIHRAVRRSSGDMEGIIAELDEAMYATDIMENIEAHAVQRVLPVESGGALKTIYCIAIKGDGAGGGVYWYDTEKAREAAMGSSTATEDVSFELSVPANASDDEITELADSAAWGNAEESVKPVVAGKKPKSSSLGM